MARSVYEYHIDMQVQGGQVLKAVKVSGNPYECSKIRIEVCNVDASFVYKVINILVFAMVWYTYSMNYSMHAVGVPFHSAG